MSKVSLPSRIRRGSLAAACGSAMVLVLVMVSAAIVTRPLPANLPAGTDVSEADSAGINLLEPTSSAHKAKGQVTAKGTVERVVSEWTPTGGGPGGSGSPKN